MNTSISTFGAMKAAGYQSKSIKTELRDNLIAALQEGKETQIVYLKPAVELFRIAEAFVILAKQDSSLSALSRASMLNERNK